MSNEKFAELLGNVATLASELLESMRRDAQEIKKLNGIVDELKDENEWLRRINWNMSEDLVRLQKGGEA